MSPISMMCGTPIRAKAIGFFLLTLICSQAFGATDASTFHVDSFGTVFTIEIQDQHLRWRTASPEEVERAARLDLQHFGDHKVTASADTLSFDVAGPSLRFLHQKKIPGVTLLNFSVDARGNVIYLASQRNRSAKFVGGYFVAGEMDIRHRSLDTRELRIPSPWPAESGAEVFPVRAIGNPYELINKGQGAITVTSDGSVALLDFYRERLFKFGPYVERLRTIWLHRAGGSPRDQVIDIQYNSTYRALELLFSDHTVGLISPLVGNQIQFATFPDRLPPPGFVDTPSPQILSGEEVMHLGLSFDHFPTPNREALIVSADGALFHTLHGQGYRELVPIQDSNYLLAPRFAERIGFRVSRLGVTVIDYNRQVVKVYLDEQPSLSLELSLERLGKTGESPFIKSTVLDGNGNLYAVSQTNPQSQNARYVGNVYNRDATWTAKRSIMGWASQIGADITHIEGAPGSAGLLVVDSYRRLWRLRPDQFSEGPGGRPGGQVIAQNIRAIWIDRGDLLALTVDGNIHPIANTSDHFYLEPAIRAPAGAKMIQALPSTQSDARIKAQNLLARLNAVSCQDPFRRKSNPIDF